MLKKYFLKGLIFLICNANKLEPTKLPQSLIFTCLRKIREIRGYQFTSKCKYIF